jgi:hypothetical protein
VLTLSIMMRDCARSPFVIDGSISRRNSGKSVASVVKGQIVTESINWKAWPWTITTGLGLPA